MKVLMIFLLVAMSYSVEHDVHISLTELEVDTVNGTAEMSLHIFLDDLEEVLAPRADLALFTRQELPDVDSVLVVYFNERIFLGNHCDTVTWQLLGRELSEDMQAAYFYLYGGLEQCGTMTFSQSVLFDLFDDQQSICRIRVGEADQHVMLDSGHAFVELIP